MTTLAEHIIIAGAENRPPMLEKSMYDSWASHIRLFIKENKSDYALWQVIDNDATLLMIQVVEGVTTVMPIASIKDKAQRRLEVKERSTLMIGIPNEHQLKFNSIKDAKQLLEAIENIFDLDTISMDDIYNNLKVYEPKVKWMSSSNSNTQNMDFLSCTNSSTNGVVNTAQGLNTANEVSTAHTQVNVVDNLSDAVIYAFMASQLNSPQLAREDLEQIYPDDMEEMDLRWQMAILTMTARRFLKKTRRKLTVNGNESLRFGMSKVECYNCHKRGHFARDCRVPRNQDAKQKESIRRSVPVETPASIALVSYDGLGRYDWNDQAEEGPNYALMAYTSLSSDSKVSNDSTFLKSCLESIKLLRSQKEQLLKDLKKLELMVLGYKTDNCKKGLGYESYNAVLPPCTGNFMPTKPDLSYTCLDELSVKPVVENKSSEEETKVVKKNLNAPIVE
nr:hypothetical protein [Tanacetum cinerariifolium]